jgi:TolB-like protein/Tfp pilus assembly protein PilF
LVQVAETVLEPFGIGDEVLRIVIIVAIIGFVPVLVFAWFFEFTATGLQRESDSTHDGRANARIDTLVNRVIIAVLGVAVTYFAVDKFLLERESAVVSEPTAVAAAIERYGDKSLLVLPFANFGPEAQDTLLGESLAAELQGRLARIREWRIISRTSAASIHARNLPLSEIVEQLQVRYVVEGSVGRRANVLEVNVSLIDGKTDIAVWNETYERPLADLFEVTDELLMSIVDNLHITVLGAPLTQDRVEPDAYIRFMRARQMLDASTPDYDQVAALIDQALALAPDYADAWATRSWLYWRYRSPGVATRYDVFRRLTPEQAQIQVTTNIDRALDLDPDNPIALAYRGWELGMDGGDLRAAAPYFERALALGPEFSDVLRTSTYFANRIVRFDAAIQIGEYSLVRDPYCSRCQFNLNKAYMSAGQYEEAERLLRSWVSTEAGGHLSLGMALMMQGKYREALDNFRIAQEYRPEEAELQLPLVLYSLGNQVESDRLLAALETRAAAEPDYYWDVLRNYAWRGESAAAIAALDKVLQNYDAEAIAMLLISDPVASKLRNHPRVIDLLELAGLSADNVSNVPFHVSLPQP